MQYSKTLKHTVELAGVIAVGYLAHRLFNTPEITTAVVSLVVGMTSKLVRENNYDWVNEK